MANKICNHGEQIKLKGGGIYFLCRFDWERQNSHCQFVRWCQKNQKYYAQTDKGGNMCPHFEILRSDSYLEDMQEVALDIGGAISNEDESSNDVDHEILIDTFKLIFSDEELD